MINIKNISRIDFGKLHSLVPQCSNINCQNKMIANKRFPEFLNKNNLSALDNYLMHKNATVYIDDLEGDMFHDISVSVLKRGVSNEKRFAMKVAESGKELAECMRTFYKNIETAIKELGSAQ